MSRDSPAGDLEAEPGSFRDPDGQVFYDQKGRVLRGLSERGARDWDRLSATTFFSEATEDGTLVRTSAAPEVAPASLGWAAVLEHDRVPFVSYPFEWPFGMLRDAAVLHLEMLLDALGEGITTKDGSAYNVQWRGVSPVFIDVSSFTSYPGGPWAGYRQFCETFLNPLLLQAHRGVDFQPWLRGRLDGIPTCDIRRLLAGRDLWQKGILKHVVLHDALQRGRPDGAQAATSALSGAGFDVGIIRTVVEGLLRMVRSLEWQPRPSAWSRYGEEKPYSPQDLAQKREFVLDAARRDRPHLVWDLGCNDGTFARAAAEFADYVVAMDADHPTIERLYGSLRHGGVDEVLPLVVDLSNPSPGLGWRAQERRPLLDRGRPDLVLCLALIHHLAITGNVPLGEILSWLHSLGGRVLLEFVAREDPMVRRLLANKAIDHGDYTVDAFEAELAHRFTVCKRTELSSSTRTLYELVPRP